MKKFGIALITASLIAGMLFTQVAVAAPSTQVSSLSWGCGGNYVVRYGDYLARIAAQCGTTIGNILAHNPQIYNPHWIYAGMVLNLSGTGSSPYYGIPYTGNYNYHPQAVVYNYVRPKPTYHTNSNPWYGGYYYNGRWWNAGYYNPGQYYGGYYRYTYHAGVDLSTYSATAGQNITVAVSGFPANVTIDIRIGLQGEGAYANYAGTTNSSGFYTMTVPIPSIAGQGQYWYVQVVGGGVQAYSHLVYITG
ncbi:MAG TPA: LysM domain-containing protein [Anaerolineaceae bacterium]|nr:LysM domain-containing protein [Anaerolineaceae bacterium]